MTHKAEKLKNAYDSDMARFHWKSDGRGLTFEDYWIFVSLVGHRTYRMYNDAHWRDSDIVDKSDVWKKLQRIEQ